MAMAAVNANIIITAMPDGLEVSFEGSDGEIQAAILLNQNGVRALYEAIETYLLTGQTGVAAEIRGN
jgi:hypothetical protein